MRHLFPIVNFAYISACAHERSVSILSEKRTLCGAAVLENFRVGLVVNDASNVLLLNEELYAAVTCDTPFDVFDFAYPGDWDTPRQYYEDGAIAQW